MSSNTVTTKSCKLSYLHLRVEQPNISARLLPREITQRLILLIPVGPPRLHPPLFTSQYHKPSIKACLPRGVTSQLVHNAAVFNIISIVLQYRHWELSKFSYTEGCWNIMFMCYVSRSSSPFKLTKKHYAWRLRNKKIPKPFIKVNFNLSYTSILNKVHNDRVLKGYL